MTYIVNPLIPNFPIFYPLKTPENYKWFTFNVNSKIQ